MLAYACGRSICRSSPNGKGIQTLTRGRQTDDRDPTWSPDGTRIAFSRASAAGKGDIYVMNADGSGLRGITTGLPDDTEPSWSPDGTRIAFTTDRDGNLEVYVMGVDGTDPKNISKSPARDSEPSWTPDGRRVVFTSDRDGKPEVYVAELDGSRTTRLTISAGSSAASWSPDGTRVVLVAAGVGLALVDLKTATVSPITTDSSDSDPQWSPLGDLIAFQRGKAGRAEVYLVGADGKGLRQATRGPVAAQTPAWGLVPS